MKRSKRIILGSNCLFMLGLWSLWLGSAIPALGQDSSEAAPAKESIAPAEGAENSASVQKAVDPNSPADPNQVKKEELHRSAPTDRRGRERKEEDDGLEALNLNDVAMSEIIPRLAEWTGKVIIPHQDMLALKITIYATKKMPRAEALARIYDVLRSKGFIAEETESVIFIKPIKDAKLGEVPTIPAEQPLAMIENKNQIVQKFFRLQNYSPTQLQRIILPLIPEHGYVSADESTKNLIVIDTVANLLRIQRIIEQLDIPESEETMTRVFEIGQGDPSEIVQVLRLLLSGDSKGNGGRSNPSNPPPQGPSVPPGGAPATSVVIDPSDSPIILIPELKRKWIIAKASADDMKKIEYWIGKLDRALSAENDYDIRKINYADVREVADQINRMVQQMPGQELKTSVLVQPLEQAGQIMVIGSEENRKMIGKLVDEIDIPTGKYITEHFKLQYADPEQLKTYMEELYDEDLSQGYNPFSYFNPRRGRGGGGQGQQDDMVRVIAYTTLKQITVIASSENMEKIRSQITEWDKPIDVKEVLPVIIELRNSDPVKMAKLLSTLFSKEATSQSRSFFQMFYGSNDERKQIVGPLYGQLTFEAVPETKKIIVISKIPEAYEVVKELVLELDRQEAAELPLVVTLKYADCENLCEQLNAILNETGTPSPFRRSTRGLSEYSIDVETGEKKTGTSTAGKQEGSADMISPWWDQSRQRRDEEMPTSNMIGKIRFIPVYRSKAIMVLAAAEYHESIRTMIEELDKPAKQVLVKAIILEVNHEDMTSLGLQLSSNSGAFGTIGENSLEAINALKYSENYGALTLSSNLNVNILVDLLIKKTNAKILNQPSIWTKDNEEAIFFKGRSVPFIEGSQSSTEGTSIRQDVKYRNVGVTLRVRPNITPEKAVDTTINLMISQVEPETLNGNIVTTLLDNTTHLIVEDGQTIMLSGILFQNDSKIERKVPLLGDIPLLGELFKHKDTVQSNSELLAFITPYVMDEESTDNARMELQRATDKMQFIREKLQETLPNLDLP